jgi:hypothetical protein
MRVIHVAWEELTLADVGRSETAERRAKAHHGREDPVTEVNLARVRGCRLFKLARQLQLML